jgi:hypothetical protein
MTGPHSDEDEQHVVIQVDAGAAAGAWPGFEPENAELAAERPGALAKFRYALTAILALVLLAGAAFAIGAATYDPPSRLPALVFDTSEPLYGMNATVNAELDLIRQRFSEPGALDLEPAGAAFRLPLPRTVADRLFGRRDEEATVFAALSAAGEFRFLVLAKGSGPRIFAVEARLVLCDPPAGVFLALDEADPAMAPLLKALDALLPRLDGVPVMEVSAEDFYVFGPYLGGDVETLRSRVAANVVMRHLAARLEETRSDVSLSAPVFLIERGPPRGTINALYHPARRLVMEPLWGDSGTASLAHELVHAYLDTVAMDRQGLLSRAADYLEDTHPVLHGEVVGDLYERLGRDGRAEETLAFLVGALAAGQTKTVATQFLLENPGNLAVSEAVLYSDVRLLVQAGLLPACMLPRDDVQGEITHAFYEMVDSEC